MAEEEKKAECKTEGCQYTACAMNWLKIVDDWSIAGWKNTFPRLYYVVAGIVVLFVLL
jgi:hypothetical protein